MQRAARQTTAWQGRVDLGYTERQRTGTSCDPAFKGGNALSQVGENVLAGNSHLSRILSKSR
jgi:hypothetical protein